MKTVKPRKPPPKDFPCLCCKKDGHQATHTVVLDDTYQLIMCEECSRLSEGELMAEFFKGRD